MVQKPYKLKGPIPPNFEAILTMLRNKGFQQDPLLAEKKGSFTNIVKHLPNGSRIHVQVRDGRDFIQIESHIDEFDPNQSVVGALGHLLEDKKRHSVRKIKKRK